MNLISILLQRCKTKGVKAAESEGICDQVKLMIGGAPVMEAFCKEIGANTYMPDAAEVTVIFCV